MVYCDEAAHVGKLKLQKINIFETNVFDEVGKWHEVGKWQTSRIFRGEIIAISLSKATLRDCSLQQYHSTSLETIFADVQAECVSLEKRSTLKWARSKLDQVIADATSTVEQQRSRMTIYIAVSCVVVVAAFALRQRLGSFQVFGSPTAST